MKTGKSLSQLAAEIERQASAKRDFISPVSKTAMSFDDAGVALNLGAAPGAAKGQSGALAIHRPLPLQSLAHQQVGEYLGIPRAYYERMLAEDPFLLTENVNRWLMKTALEKPDTARLVRTMDGKVRAFLSDRYRPLEYAELAEAVLPVLLEQELFIASCEITERRIYIKAFDKRIEREIRVKGSDPAHTFLKDVCFPAITVSNSEVGCGALSVAAGLYTGGCTNFASFSDSRMRKYHLGQKAEGQDSVYELLTDESKVANDKALWLMTRDVVRSAFEIARFEERIARIQETADQKIEGDPVKAVELTRVHFGFSKEEGTSILKNLIEGGTLSRYGMFNAITRAAQDVDDYDRATSFEQAGGEVIELPKREWERIAKAA